MSDKVKDKVKELLSSGKIKGFLGLCSRDGNIAPHLFVTEDELDNLVVGDKSAPGDSRYPLNRQLINLVRAYPDDTFGILVRGCDERGLAALASWNQINPNKIEMVGIACPQELAIACECLKPYPESFVDGEKCEGVTAETVARIDSLKVKERFDLWLNEFSKCIKCYGCRNICPMCFCNECSLENDELIRKGEIPPEIPTFHLTRAVHMAGRCIDCGLCSEACPADIPLRTLYKKVADIIYKQYNFRAGYDAGQKSPLNFLGGLPE
ncbi:4Fe-4S binding domain protein [uncultured Desulfobacterium sp.]|uniref:4Fe-4S binding domain protein n=1 Tax=uncultured Desulfobacterium sp. TaxID=201089 RepID=A0A445N3I1_9BACT|nr:4Fe-4S binding domain protein [uncultured Desulfobacterium sp.]